MGVRPLPMTFDLRNKRVRKHQYMVFSTKKYEKFNPSPDPLVGRGIPHPTWWAPATPRPLPF